MTGQYDTARPWRLAAIKQVQPFQGFQWSDYSAKPGHEYSYSVVPMYGSPAALNPGQEVSVTVKAEPEWGPPDSPHSVFFNRGSIATQEYARRFQNQPPKLAGQAAYDWLSRGLHEALLFFIGRAVNEKWTICGAVYEFQDQPVLAALAAADARGARISVVYDAIPGDGPKEKNEQAIADAHIGHICKARTHGKIMHNKFFVLAENGVPKAVRTGSTNLTENGIYGHSNVGHAVEDEAVARSYLAYWDRLQSDPALSAGSGYKTSNDSDILALQDPPAVATIFSPRSSLEALQWYGTLASSAESGLFMTFAFGLNAVFQKVFGTDDDVLRFGLLEKRTAYTRDPARAEDLARIHTIAALKNVVFAVGNRIVTNEFDRWLQEMAKLDPQHGTHVQWIHDKFMLVDPLGDTPLVVTGSANFSAASTTDNDENMLVIQGDKRVADIYLGEFMRLHSHYAFREALQIHIENGGEVSDWTPQFLASTDAWQVPYFDSENSSGKCARRLFFAQDIA